MVLWKGLRQIRHRIALRLFGVYKSKSRKADVGLMLRETTEKYLHVFSIWFTREKRSNIRSKYIAAFLYRPLAVS